MLLAHLPYPTPSVAVGRTAGTRCCVRVSELEAHTPPCFRVIGPWQLRTLTQGRMVTALLGWPPKRERRTAKRKTKTKKAREEEITA